MRQDRRGGKCGERGKDPDMADMGNQPRGDDGGDEKADRIARHDNAGNRGGEAFDAGPHAEQRVLQAVAEHQEPDAEQQRPVASDREKHRVSPCDPAMLCYADPRSAGRP
ncbi:MAG: hypothetical protein R3C69_01425 [Geminicoccaceae bacterium]